MTSTGWRVLAGVFGALLVAFVGAPLSVDQVFLVGPDQPSVIGEQFVAQFFGAAATAVAIVLARHWRWLLVVGAVGTTVAHAIRVPRAQGVTVAVTGSGKPSPMPVPDITAHTVWVCLLVATTSLLLVGVLAVAQEVLRTNRFGACVAGFAGCAGYFGVAVVGRLRGVDAPARSIVVAVVAAVVVLAVLRLREPAPGEPHPMGSWARLVAAAAAAVWLLPTMMVAIRGQAIFGTVTGGLVGLVVLGVALGASRPAGVPGMLAVGATGLVLALPVTMLVLLYDVPLGGVWYGWPIAFAGVVAGAASAAGPWGLRAGIVGAAGLSMVGLAVRLQASRSIGELIVWLFLALSLAAVAATIGTATQILATVDAAPGLAGLGTLAALGVFGTLNLLRLGRGQAGLEKTLGSTLNWVSAVLLLGAAALMLVLGRQVSTSAARSGRSATGQAHQSR